MSRKRTLGLLAAVAVVVSVLSVGAGYAEPGSAPAITGYELEWRTIDGGGGDSAGGGFSLSGTIGQPDAGVLIGGGYTLNGGFWPGAAASYKLFLPLVLRG